MRLHPWGAFANSNTKKCKVLVHCERASLEVPGDATIHLVLRVVDVIAPVCTGHPVLVEELESSYRHWTLGIFLIHGVDDVVLIGQHLLVLHADNVLLDVQAPHELVKGNNDLGACVQI